MRAYVPLTLDLLAKAADEHVLPAGTDMVLAEDESEEAEYDALMTAAALSAELSGGVGRRVVLAAEVDGPDVAVPRAAWAAVHVDPEDDHDPEDDLAWFGVQEIPGLLASS